MLYTSPAATSLTFKQQLKLAFRRYIANPELYISTQLGITPTWQQMQLVDAYKQGHKRIAVRSGMGPGKTFTTSLIALHFALFPNAKIIVTAPGMSQCKDIWLAQAKKIATSSSASKLVHYMYECQGTGFKVLGNNPSEWGCLLRTSSNSSRMRGHHEKNMLFILEEAGGDIPEDIWNVIKSTLTSGSNNRLIAIGNPAQRDTPFFDCFYGPSAFEYYHIHWNSEETPPEVYDHENSRRIEREYGRDSDVYRVNILGEFPNTSTETVITSDEIRKAANPSRLTQALLYRHPATGKIRKQFGIDFGRTGDYCVVYQVMGNAVINSWIGNNVEPKEAVMKAFEFQERAGWGDEECIYVPDATGMGQGVLTEFYEAKKRVFEFHSHGTSRSGKKYHDHITMAYYNVADAVKNQGAHIPEDDVLFRQLYRRKVLLDSKSRPALEPKDCFKKLWKESPDRADALAMAFFDTGNSSNGKLHTCRF